MNKNDTTDTNGSTIFSTRINKRSTSFSIKNTLIAFYCTVTETECIECSKEFNKFVLDIVQDWNGESARGLSDFVQEKVLVSLLKKKDVKLYKKILKKL